jgi:predicted ArsR family transcriptional regulator
VSKRATPDVVGSYANRIRVHLVEAAKSMTAAEICTALKLSDRVVRMGLDRLVFCNEVSVEFRHEPHRRGAMPREYAATPQQ